MFNVFAARNKIPRPSLLHCGDDASAKKVAVGLIRDVGYEPVEVGPLRMARHLERFAMVVAQLAYGGQWSPELVYRFERLGA
jgi:predicted dinucleotide-binding enzyme